MQKLINMMDGSITVESDWGQGSTFTIRFPAAKGRFDMSETLLIIEDNEQNFYMMRFSAGEKRLHRDRGGKWPAEGIEKALQPKATGDIA
jgi:hypothetical protein